MTQIIDPLDRERLMRGDMNKKPKSLWHVAGKKAWIVAAIYGIVRFFLGSMGSMSDS